MFEHELASQGLDEEFAALREKVMSQVVPRLLRPMEFGERKILPRLVHGDLWEGNTGTDLETGLPKIFDACCLYAHNECEYHPSFSSARYGLTAILQTRCHRGDL